MYTANQNSDPENVGNYLEAILWNAALSVHGHCPLNTFFNVPFCLFVFFFFSASNECIFVLK